MGEVEVSMEELSILGIDTPAPTSKKRKKKKKKKKKNNSGSAADATSAAAAATSTAAGDTSATASSTTSKPVLSKQDVKAKLRGKIKKKKHGSNKAEKRQDQMQSESHQQTLTRLSPFHNGAITSTRITSLNTTHQITYTYSSKQFSI